jgi:hypothetical protein
MKRFNTLPDVRRYLSDLLRRLEKNEISESKARTAGYLSNILRGVLESSDLEERLQRLEGIIDEKFDPTHRKT